MFTENENVWKIVENDVDWYYEDKDEFCMFVSMEIRLEIEQLNQF